MNLTNWEFAQVLLALVLIPALATAILILIIRMLRPLAARFPLVRLLCRLLGLAAIMVVLGTVAFVVIGVSIECFGERAVLTWGPTTAIVFLGVVFYGWGRLAWRFRKEARIGPRCPKCAYDLKGLAITQRPPCPECGRQLPKSERALFRAPVRKWATRLGVALSVLGLVGPTAVRVYRLGWVGAVPDGVLLRMLVWNVHADEALRELGNRRVSLATVDPHWTRDLMVSFADEFDAATIGSKPAPWGIYNRFYPLYQAPNDAETVELAKAWTNSPSVGRRFTAVGMMTVNGFCPQEDRLRLLRPLLKDPDMAVRANALRALTYDAAFPLSELIEFLAADGGKIWSGEVDTALRRYTDPAAIQRRLQMAADTNDTWADMTTWGLMHAGFAFVNDGYTDGTFRTLAHAKAVFPTARSAWTRGSAAQQFDQVYRRLAERAAAKPGTEGEDAVTAAWCLGALKSYATTTPNGANVPMSVAITAAIDALLVKEAAGPYRDRLLQVRNAIAPGDGASAPSPGEEMGRGR